MKPKVLLAVGLSLVLVYAPVAPGAAPAAVGKLRTRGAAEVNGIPMPSEATVFAGDRIATHKDTAVALSLPGGDQVFLPELSAVQVKRTGSRIAVVVEQGALAVVARSSHPVVAEANGVRIRPAQNGFTIYEVAVKGKSLQVFARKGMALVEASNRTVEVKEGMALDATTGPGPQGVGASGMSSLAGTMLVVATLLGIAGVTLASIVLNRPNPKDCRVTGTTSPFQLTCD